MRHFCAQGGMKRPHSRNKIFCILVLMMSMMSVQRDLWSQHDSTGFRALVYPLGYYSPETRLGLGLAGVVNFQLNADTITPVSQLGFGFGLTQNDQYTLALPFAYYSKKRKHSFSGEWSSNEFNYWYYGTGAGNESGERVRFDMRYVLFRLNYLYQIKRHYFIGARWWHQNDKRIEFYDTLSHSSDVSGLEGGVSSGPGVVLNFDNRDNIYFTHSGWYAELVVQDQSAIWGSDFQFNRYRFDLRNFTPIKKNLILANQIFIDLTTGDVPFNQLAIFGSGRRGRGYYMGRYRDRHLMMYQGEGRLLLDKRWAFTAHWIYALLSKDMGSISLKNDHASAGFGLRYIFDQNSRSTLRLDLSLPIDRGVFIHEPDNAIKFYFSVNEAF